MKGGRTQDAPSLNRGLSVRAPRRGKSSEILNAQLPDLFSEMHRAMRRDATRCDETRRVFGTRDRDEGQTNGRTDTKARERDARMRAETAGIPSLLPRVSIQRSDKKCAKGRELSNQTRVAKKKRAARSCLSLSLFPSHTISFFPFSHCLCRVTSLFSLLDSPETIENRH